MAVTYFPVVKAKTAEWKALSDIDLRASRSRPVLELVPLPLTRKVPPTELEWLQEIDRNMTSSCAGGTVLLDPYLLRTDDPDAGSGAAFDYFANVPDARELRIVPVIRIDSGQDSLKSAKRVVEASSSGAAVRILESQLSSSVGDGGISLNARIGEALSALDIDPSKADLLLDLGAMSPHSSADLYVNGLLSAVPLIEDVKAFRHVVVLGSSAPAMNNVAKFDAAVLPRHELGVFLKLSSRDTSGARLAFGDYVGFAPDLPVGEARTKHPALRYSREQDIVIVRREAEKGAGFAVFTEVCEYIVAQPWYLGSGYSQGDFYIHEVSAGRTTASGGGATAWRAAAVNHHITLTADQMAKLP